jgi:putative copper export protein
MTATFVVATAVQWVAFAALAALVGGLVLDVMVVPTGPTEFTSTHGRLRRGNRIGAGLLFVTALAALLLRAQTMAGGGLAAGGAAVPLVLTRTHFGAVWIARLALLGIVVAGAGATSLAARRVALGAALGVTLTTALTGHAADRGDLSLAVGIDWLHVVAACAWTGGLFGLAIMAAREWPGWPPELIGVVARRFSRLAGWALPVVVATGAYNAWRQLPGVPALWTTPYGRLLLLKLLAAAALAALGATNRWTIVPRLGPGPARDGFGVRVARIVRLARRGARAVRQSLVPRFGRLVRREAFLGLGILAVTAALTESTPARHAGHVHGVTDIHAPVTMSMEELHEHGGVPPGWTFTLPDGDPDRGQRLFRRLECFRCHAVAGASFPPPTAPGPPLTGMGAHHPAGYLAESIVNPNAVIVEGPGYIGRDGRSTMPDYSGSISVTDLIDLVAYLRTLVPHEHPAR